MNHVLFHFFFPFNIVEIIVQRNNISRALFCFELFLGRKDRRDSSNQAGQGTTLTDYIIIGQRFSW